MADTYEKDLAQKSSLTASDFIRVVGEDNVSYKQGMQSVSDRVIMLASKTGSGDANNLTTAGMYWCNGASVSNLPNSNYFRVRVEVYGGTYNQYANLNGSAQVYFRTYSNSKWSAWVKLPTREEIDALQQKTPYAGMLTEEVQTAGKTYTASNSLRAILYVTDSTPANCGEYILATTGAGVWYTKAVSEASNLTITTSTANKLTLKPSAGSRRIMFLVLYGTIS